MQLNRVRNLANSILRSNFSSQVWQGRVPRLLKSVVAYLIRIQFLSKSTCQFPERARECDFCVVNQNAEGFILHLNRSFIKTRKKHLKEGWRCERLNILHRYRIFLLLIRKLWKKSISIDFNDIQMFLFLKCQLLVSGI